MTGTDNKRYRSAAEELEEKRRRSRMIHRKRRIKHGIYVAVVCTFLLIVSLIFLFPIVLTITNSFMSQTEIAASYGKIFSSLTGKRVFVAEVVHLKLIPDMVSFSQYSTALIKSPDYLLKFWNSVLLVVPITLFQIAVALCASYALARFDSKFRSFVFFAYVILMLMPYQVTLVPNYLVAGWLHILNTRWSIILPGVFSPYAVFLLTKFMKRIPSAIIEAAKLDGCGEWKIFTRICVPLCRSVIWSVAVLVFIDYWNMVEQPLILLPDADAQPLSVFLAQINAGEIGLAFAMATVYMVPSLLLFLHGEEYLVEGIANSGSVKG